MTTTAERAGDTTRLGYTRVARYESRSSAGRFYWVSANQQGELSCQCRGWIHNKHCRHVADVEQRSRELGGVTLMLRMLRQGLDVHVGEATQATPVAGTVYQRQRARGVNRLVPVPADPITLEAQAVCTEYFGGSARPSRGHVELRNRIEAAIRKFAGQRPATSTAPHPATATGAMPDWLGGGRAIRLREE